MAKTENINETVVNNFENQMNKKMNPILWGVASVCAAFAFWTMMGKIEGVDLKVDKIVSPDGYLAKVNERVIRLEGKIKYPVTKDVENRVVDKTRKLVLGELKDHYTFEIRESENRLYRFFGNKVLDKIAAHTKECKIYREFADKDRKDIWDLIKEECIDDK